MKISQKIHQMNEFCEDTQQIADTLGISKEIVDKYLQGEIPESVLENYDPSRPPDIKIVEQAKFISSRCIGILSFGGSGGTTLTSALAGLSERNLLFEVGAIDLNEYSSLALHFGAGIYDTSISLSCLTGDVVKPYIPKSLDRLNIYTASLTPVKQLTPAQMLEKIVMLSNKYGLIWVDCPSSPYSWAVLEKFDFIILVLRTDVSSLNKLFRIMPVLEKITNRCIIALTDTGQVPVSECRKTIAEICQMPVKVVLPNDKTVDKALMDGKILADQNCSYMNAVYEIFEMLYPGNITKQPKKKWFAR